MTDDTKTPAVGVPLHGPVGRAARTLLAALMRLLLLAPLRLVRGLLWCASAGFEKLGECVREAESAIAPVCELPFHADAARQLAEAKAEERLRILAVMERVTR
jgi:hypothetical protein